MRRIALALVALVFMLGVAACGGDEEASPEPETTEGTITTETETTETETTDTGETGADGDPVAGKAVFVGPGGCGSCPPFSDAGTSGTIGPNLDESQPSFDLAVDRVTNGQGAMPAFGETLTQEQ